MKKLLVIFTMISAIAACNNGQENKTETPAEETKTSTSSSDLSSNPDYQKGLALVGANNCLTCHKINERVVGPSYREVAEKYSGATPEVITQLGEKVIKGGNGVWGEALMTPHPQISQADAEAMVKYILLLKK